MIVTRRGALLAALLMIVTAGDVLGLASGARWPSVIADVALAVTVVVAFRLRPWR